jgi:hypothetical protein
VPVSVGFGVGVRVDDGAAGERFGVEEFDSASARGAKQGFAGSFDDGRGTDPVLVEQTGCGESVGELSDAPDEDVASFGLFQLHEVVNERRFGNDHGWVPERRVDGLRGDDVFGDRVDVVVSSA